MLIGMSFAMAWPFLPSGRGDVNCTQDCVELFGQLEADTRGTTDKDADPLWFQKDAHLDGYGRGISIFAMPALRSRWGIPEVGAGNAGGDPMVALVHGAPRSPTVVQKPTLR